MKNAKQLNEVEFGTWIRETMGRSPFRSKLLKLSAAAEQAGDLVQAKHLMRKVMKNLLVEQGRHAESEALGLAE